MLQLTIECGPFIKCDSVYGYVVFCSNFVCTRKVGVSSRNVVSRTFPHLSQSMLTPMRMTRFVNMVRLCYTSWLPGFARAPPSLPASLSLSPSLSPPSRPPLPLTILGLPGFAIAQDNYIPEIFFLT